MRNDGSKSHSITCQCRSPAGRNDMGCTSTRIDKLKRRHRHRHKLRHAGRRMNRCRYHAQLHPPGRTGYCLSPCLHSHHAGWQYCCPTYIRQFICAVVLTAAVIKVSKLPRQLRKYPSAKTVPALSRSSCPASPRA